MNNNPTPQPPRPTVPPSEPEATESGLQEILDKAASSNSRKVIGLNNIRDTLTSAGLDVDDNGFIIREATSEYATPYMYSRDAFRSIESPVENPISTYSRPESDVDECLLSHGRVHLSDLHTVKYIDEKAYPFRDDSMPLSYMHKEIGFIFNTVTQWSDARDLVDSADLDGMTVIMNHPGMANQSLEIECLKCSFTAEPEQWDGEDTDPVCPDCGGHWNSNGLEFCTDCRTLHWWENMGHVGEGMHREPRCPDCQSGPNSHKRITRYSDDLPEEYESIIPIEL